MKNYDTVCNMKSIYVARIAVTECYDSETIELHREHLLWEG